MMSTTVRLQARMTVERRRSGKTAEQGFAVSGLSEVDDAKI